MKKQIALSIAALLTISSEALAMTRAQAIAAREAGKNTSAAPLSSAPVVSDRRTATMPPVVSAGQGVATASLKAKAEAATVANPQGAAAAAAQVASQLAGNAAPDQDVLKYLMTSAPSAQPVGGFNSNRKSAGR